MSYSRPGLGQSKSVPGQVAFMTSHSGRVPRIQRMFEAGVAPYIEHGSYITGEPDIVRYSYDPYRGIMGCGMGDVLVHDVKEKIELIPTVREAAVEMVFEPPWNQSMMSQAARLQTGML